MIGDVTKRGIVLLVLLTTTVACGGRSPLDPEGSQALSLAAGRYRLHIFTGSRTQVANGVPFTTSLCLTIGSRSSGDSIALTVDVAREDARWAARALDGTLRLRLDERSGSLSGTLEGQAAAGGVTVTIGDGSGAPATATVTATAGPSSFNGTIDGDVLFSGPGGSQSCSDNGWSLTPQ